MFQVIDVQDTPNPDALKFVLNDTLLTSGVRQFDSPAAAKEDPLAGSLFEISGVQSVFYMGKFVTVTKESGVQWTAIQPSINKAIKDNAPRINPLHDLMNQKKNVAEIPTDNPSMLEKINLLLEESVRPALAGDGGGLEVLSFQKKKLTIFYQGACGTCPSSTAGTLGAVQNLLRKMIDQEITVVAGKLD